MSETQEIVNENPNPEPELSQEDAEQAQFLAEEPETEPETEPEQPLEEPQQQEPSTVDATKYQNVQKALSQSRFEQRQTQRQLKEMREMLGQLAQPAQERGEDPVIDVDNDPIGAIRYLTAKVNAYEHQAQQQAQQHQAKEQEQAIRGQIQTYMAESEAVARSDYPDYNEAAQYLVQSRQNELQALGYPQDTILNTIRDEYEGLAYQAMQNGQNPAYLVYNQARARGFTGPQPEQQKPQPAAAAQKQLTAMKRGQQAPRTQRGAGAGRSSSGVTMDMLMDASGAEFDKMWAQFEKQNAQ